MGCGDVIWVVPKSSATEEENAIVNNYFLIKNGVASEHEHLNLE